MYNKRINKSHVYRVQRHEVKAIDTTIAAVHIKRFIEPEFMRFNMHRLIAG